jgi:hypothetical protein
MKARDRVRNAIFDVVDNQIRQGTPPETKQTLDRLIKEGHSESEARKLIAAVVAAEIFDVLKYEQLYDEVRFITALHALPNLQNEED